MLVLLAVFVVSCLCISATSVDGRRVVELVPVRPRSGRPSAVSADGRLHFTPLVKPRAAMSKGIAGPGQFCETCIQLMVDAINILANAILNQGIIGECEDLCNYLPLQIEAELCAALCAGVGLEAFIKVISDADLDPIWACEMLDGVCPYTDNAKANITTFAVSPKQGAMGTTFNINLVFDVLHAMGTGQLILLITPPGANPQQMGEEYLMIGTPPGSYQVQVPCDSGMTSANEPFNAGVYPVNVVLCEGMCGSIHSNSYTMFNRTIAFTITN